MNQRRFGALLLLSCALGSAGAVAVKRGTPGTQPVTTQPVTQPVTTQPAAPAQVEAAPAAVQAAPQTTVQRFLALGAQLEFLDAAGKTVAVLLPDGTLFTSKATAVSVRISAKGSAQASTYALTAPSSALDLSAMSVRGQGRDITLLALMQDQLQNAQTSAP